MSRGTVTRIELTAPDATLRFDRKSDRYSHCLIANSNAQASVLLEAVLEDPMAAWPSDPPLQQLVIEPIGDRSFPDVALGVGMSGHGHWSLAAQWIVVSGLGAPALEFDYACKSQPPVGFVGSTYRVVEQRELLLASQAVSPGLELKRIEFELKNWTGWFKELGSPSSKIVNKLSVDVLDGQLHWDSDSQQITIRPVGSLDKPATLRWCYRIAWIACDE
ncbi:MAG: hypothetical protein NTV29_02590 [Planctomycetota bacterium]|nr:hypothetical protein [Planctomycetota bacterium]